METPSSSPDSPPSKRAKPLPKVFSRISGLPLNQRFWLALIVIIGAGLVTILQTTAPDAFRPPRKLVSLSWWRYPIEWNSPSSLPKIECDLNAIYAVPNTDYLWAIGNKGMVLVSMNGGLTWTKRALGRSQLAPSSTSPQPSEVSPEDERLISVYFSDPNEGVVFSDQDHMFSTSDGGMIWQASRLTSAPPHLRTPGLLNQWYLRLAGNLSCCKTVYALETQVSRNHQSTFFAQGERGWVAGSQGLILATTDAGKVWRNQTSGTTSQLNSISVLPDGLRGWIVGNDGLILSTSDGGLTWIHQTQGKDAAGRYVRFPAPWYFLLLVLLALTLLRRTATPPEESVADVLISDRPVDTPASDVLSFNAIAVGLSRFLRNENTMPPLTIAITGEWGTGKSSLMNLLRADLRSYHFRNVWFNAWHHQKEEHMLASLLENIKLQAVPRWWTIRGVLFRARLLKIRGWRHWGPLLLLLFFIYVMLLYNAHQQGAGNSVADIFKVLAAAFSKPGGPETVSHFVTLISLLVGISTFIGAVWRGITAFGVKPASLLAGVSRSVSIRTLEASTSFRQNFAVEFNDVTRALGDRSLLIFIDDLDRCRPENVLETLEAVNFLTTSGECFVVIGMARAYVERCVGQAFKSIAEEMIEDVPDMPQPQGNGNASSEHAKKKRIEFARQYLDKLINIEVRVPTIKKEQALKLLLTGVNQVKPFAPRPRWQELKAAPVNLVRRHGSALGILVVLTVLGIGGYYLAMNLGPPESGTTPSILKAELTPIPTPNQTVASPTPTLTNGQAKPLAIPEPSPIWTPLPIPDTRNQRAEVTLAGRALVSRYVLPVIALLGLLWLGVTLLTRRPEAIVKDSPGFVGALKIWQSVIFSNLSTPRSTKRFMNRVRYLAMRQRPPTENRSLLSRTSLSLKQTANDNSSATADVGSDNQMIPDEILVALAALEHSFPEWLHSDDALTWPHITDSSNLEWRSADNARKYHEVLFKSFAVLQFRGRFLEMSEGVEVR